MNKYYVDLDGVSMITTYDTLTKGDILSVDELGDKTYYRIREVNDKNLTLRIVRAVDGISELTKFRYKNEDDERFYFENRLSVGQSVSANGKLYKMESKEDVSGLLMIPVPAKSSQVLYGVYENKFSEGLTRYDRESKYSAVMYTTSHKEALLYIANERSEGGMVSL